jgi:hypothetical protein
MINHIYIDLGIKEKIRKVQRPGGMLIKIKKCWPQALGPA